MKHKKNGSFSQFVLVALILLITSASFINIINNKFVWDDRTFILKWHAIRKIDLPEYFKGITPENHEGVYRPLRTVFYGISYRFFGTHAPYYRLQAISLHLISTVLVYIFVRRLTRKPIIALSSSLLFGIHPVHTESIDFATASFDLFSPIFTLSSLILYLYHLEKERLYYLILSIFFTLLAFLAGEAALTIPFLIGLLYIFSKRKNKKRAGLSIVGLYFLLLVFYVIVRIFFLKIMARGDFTIYSSIVIWIFMLRAVWRYISILFFPLHLNVDYEVGRTDVAIFHSGNMPFWQPFINLNAILGILSIILSVYLFFRYKKTHPLVSFSIAFFFIALAPFSNILPVNASVAERYLYLPSVGWCILVSYLLYSLYVHLRQENPSVIYFRLVKIAYFFLALLLISRTMIRNRDWKDSYSLWSQTTRSSPKSAIALNNLGQALAMQKEYDRAILSFQTILLFSPKHRYVHSNIGQVYLMQDKPDEAISSFRKAIEVNPQDWDAYNYLTKTLYKKGDSEKASETLKEILSKNPNDESFNSLGFIYLSQGNIDEAIKAYENSISINPVNPVSFNNLAVAHLSLGNYSQAADLLNTAIELYPDDPEYHFNLGNALKNMGLEEEATKAFENALKREPDFAMAKQMLENNFK